MSSINITKDSSASFCNNVDFCVGTGRLGLGLTDEYLKELKLVQDIIGFKHIRGHGLFCDDVAIYHEYEEDGIKKVEYNYTYIDRIFDEYIKVGIRPFLELGFMPSKLASGEQTIFYWKGNTTPPKDYSMWCDMVVALLAHLEKRYGSEVLDWPIEVWNEPNLPGFWFKADMQEYFRLFKETFLAIKAHNPAFKVGGPAVCGGSDKPWIEGFMKFCHENGLHPDFITRHHYTIEFPEHIGHYDYSKLMSAEEGFENLQSTRDIIDSYEEYKGLPIHITEFNTSYTPKGIIHDTNLNAAFLAQQLSRLGDINESYSYWTFGDVFEEQGVPFTPFHGGFGLVASGCIPKPTFWTFAFFKALKEASDNCVFKDDSAVILKTAKGYSGVLWNIAGDEYDRVIDFADADGEYTLITKTVDEECCNPLKVWHDLGEPANPSASETELIKSAASPFVASGIINAADGKASVSLKLRHNGVVYFELNKRDFTPDRGYDYERVVRGEN